MILTCPECATSYFVADGRIPPEGRRVKCTSCGARWMAQGDDDPLAALMEAAEPGPPALEPSQPPEAAAGPEADDLIITGPEAEPAADEPAPEADSGLRKRPASAARKPAPAPVKARGGGAMLWGGLAAMIAALVAAGVVFREDIVRVVPQTASAFEGVGLGVPGGGLVIEGVKAEPTFVSGRPALEITGSIRNLRGQAAAPPPLRISLVNRAGKPLAAKTARTAGDSIPAHARRYFALAIVEPPADAHDLEVTFLPQEGAAHVAPAHAAPSHASEAEAAPPHGPAEPAASHAEASSDHG